jgi:type II secretion system protein H
MHLRGFTLIELLVVLAILVLTATILPVAFNRAIPSRRVEVVLRQLEVVIQTAQGWSLVRGEPVMLKVEPNSITCAGSAASVANCSASWTGRTSVALNDSLNHSLNSFYVYPDGSSDGGLFTARDGARRGSLTLSALTGRMTVARKL